MAANQYVTSLNENTSLYITRQEVITALSTIAGDLSGASTSTLFYNPNLQLSTLKMNPSGIIQGFVPIQTSNLVLASTTNLNQAGNIRLGAVGATQNAAIMATDTNANAAPMRALSFLATGGGSSGFAAGWGFSSNGFNTFDGTYTQTPVLTWAYGNNSRIALTNISSINGAPVGQGISTYSNLTGSNITNSQVINTPSIVGVSSLNGSNITTFANVQTWVPYTLATNPSSNITMTSNTPQLVLSYSNLPITAAVGRFINISCAFNVQPSSGVVGSQTNVQLAAFIGGATSNLNTGVYGMVSLSPGSQSSNRSVTLSGVAAANGTANVLQIYAISDQSLNLTFQAASFYNRFFFQQIV